VSDQVIDRTKLPIRRLPFQRTAKRKLDGESGIGETMDAALPPGSGGVIAVYDSDGADAMDKTLANDVIKSVAQIDGARAKELKARMGG
jgi:uncharacterized lipoprotein YbaY